MVAITSFALSAVAAASLVSAAPYYPRRQAPAPSSGVSLPPALANGTSANAAGVAQASGVAQATGLANTGVSGSASAGASASASGDDTYDAYYPPSTENSQNYEIVQETPANTVGGQVAAGGQVSDSCGGAPSNSYGGQASGSYGSQSGSYSGASSGSYSNQPSGTYNYQSSGTTGEHASGTYNYQSSGSYGNVQSSGSYGNQPSGSYNGQASGSYNGQASGSYNGQASGSYNGEAAGSYNGQPSNTNSGAASIATHRVLAGFNGLNFEPKNIQAEIGDLIEVHFQPKNHSIAQSSFDRPCEPIGDDAIFSGFMPTGSGEAPDVFTITVQDKNPMWFYCSQTTGNHCQMGMAMVVNQNYNSQNTLDAYIRAASQTEVSTSPARVQGGTLGPAPNGPGL